jgi:hypothetical protein
MTLTDFADHSQSTGIASQLAGSHWAISSTSTRSSAGLVRQQPGIFPEPGWGLETLPY